MMGIFSGITFVTFEDAILFYFFGKAFFRHFYDKIFFYFQLRLRLSLI